jgi:hypothetical protein
MYRLLVFFAGGLLFGTLGSGLIVGITTLDQFDTENLFPPDSNCAGNHCFRVTQATVNGNHLDVQLSVYRPTGPFLLDESAYRAGHIRARLRFTNGLPLGNRDLVPACELDNADTGVVRGECLVRYELDDLRRRPASGDGLTLEVIQRAGRLSLNFAMP